MDIFAGSLPFKLKETELRTLFEEFGEVTSVSIVIDKITRQNKGFGFIVMPNDNEAKAAIAALDGKEVLGRPIIVNISDKDKKEAKPNDRRNDFKQGGAKKPNDKNGGGFNRGKGGGFKNKGGGFNNNRNDGGFNKKKGGGFNRDKRNNSRDE